MTLPLVHVREAAARSTAYLSVEDNMYHGYNETLQTMFGCRERVDVKGFSP